MKHTLLLGLLVNSAFAQIGFTKFTPITSNGTWLNQGDASISTANGYLTMTAPATGSVQVRGYFWSLGANTTATLVMQYAPPVSSGTASQGSFLMLRDSTSGKLWLCGLESTGSSRQFLNVRTIWWDSATALAGPPVIQPVVYAGEPYISRAGTIIFRAVSNGTTIACSMGATPAGPFANYYTAAISSWPSFSAPDQVGIAVYANGAGEQDVTRFLSLKLE